jgi:agmatinase
MTNTKSSFGGLTGDYASYDRSRIVVLPVPFDKTCTWLKGAGGGPKAIIDASAHMEVYDIETESEVYLEGIHTAKPVLAESSAQMIEETFGRVNAFLGDKKFVVTLGGEHSVSIGPVRAHKEFFRDMSVLHLDAHSDRREAYNNDPLSHACAISRISEFVENIVSVGIRSMDSSEVVGMDAEKIFFAHEIHDKKNWIPSVVKRLTKNVYVTVDLDVFDPAVMPSTGTPEPGGLGWYQVDDLLSAVAKKRNIVGFDVVELAPSESNKAPDFLAAKLVYRLLSEKFSRH